MTFIPGSDRIPGIGQRVVLQRSPGAPGVDRKVLLIGYRLSTASDQDDDTAVRVRNRNDAIAIGGAGSMLDLMAAGAFEAGRLALTDDAVVGAVPEIYVMPIAEPAEVGDLAAEYTLTLAGTATAAGTLTAYVHGRAVTVSVLAGDLAADVAARVETALALPAPDLFYTFSRSGAVHTFTCRHKGTAGNQLVVWADVRNAPGITAASAQTVVGVGDVDLSTALSASLAIDFDMVALPQSDSTTRDALVAHVTAAWRYDVARYQIPVFPGAGTVSTAQTDALALTHWRVTLPHAEKVAGVTFALDPKSSASKLSFVLGAEYASRMMSQRAPNFNFNGASLPGGGRPSNLDRDVLNDTLSAGVAEVIEDVNRPGLSKIVDPITTASTDQTGATSATDYTWAPIEIPKTVAYILRQMDIALAKFSQAQADETTRISIKAAALRVLRQAEIDKYITGAPGPDGFSTKIDNTAVTVQFEIAEGKTVANVELDYAVITGLDQVAVTHNVSRAL
jgi:hypothetical protein